jgi:hypothetical protein
MICVGPETAHSQTQCVQVEREPERPMVWEGYKVRDILRIAVLPNRGLLDCLPCAQHQWH